MTDTKFVDKNYAAMNKIKTLRDEADGLLVTWLKSNGWTLTSSTSGCYWMWRKDEFFCDIDTAERIQETLCSSAYFDAYPEESHD